MPIGESLDVALKEWNVVCQALGTGRQIILLRKGGIHESSSGFELEHVRFLLFPTYLHQNLKMLKPDVQADFEPHSSEPARITLSFAAEVTDIIRLKYRSQIDVLDSEHIWTSPLIDMRFNYKPENPLYLLIVRAYRLAQHVTVDNTPEYAGCKSWVPLETQIDVAGATPAMDDMSFKRRQRAIASQLDALAES
ncbi:MAG TPA: DUF1802 family protein [Tepidisphaeraceae bacterium]|nr:DUF1802 family protein [Tepidisphaeraceae bacterium]